MNKPLVSVVIPIYNPGKHLAVALGSIIDQSFQNWEMICVNDGSTDSSLETLKWFSNRDKRIQIIDQPNGGIVRALNRGCLSANADLICRMDADDIAMPSRIEQQVAFMNQNPEHVAVGGCILAIDSESEPLGIQKLPWQHDLIVENLLNRRTGLFHPTSMIRAEAMHKIGGYRDQYQWIEDHDLWLRLSQVGLLENMREVVLCYRQHASSICWQKSVQQRDLMGQLLQEFQMEYGLKGREGLQDTHPTRVKANPGKWARMAARGGYPKTAQKHLFKLWKEQRWSVYTARMTAEVMLRIASSVWKRKPDQVEIPNMEAWSDLVKAV